MNLQLPKDRAGHSPIRWGQGGADRLLFDITPWTVPSRSAEKRRSRL